MRRAITRQRAGVHAAGGKRGERLGTGNGYRHRAVARRAVAELAVRVLPPADDAAARDEPARVPATHRDRRETMAAADADRIGAVGSTAIAQLTGAVAAPAVRRAIG